MVFVNRMTIKHIVSFQAEDVIKMVIYSVSKNYTSNLFLLFVCDDTDGDDDDEGQLTCIRFPAVTRADPGLRRSVPCVTWEMKAGNGISLVFHTEKKDIGVLRLIWFILNQ